MSIGLCCMYVKEIKKKNSIELKNIFEEKRLLYSKVNSYSKQKIKDTWISNIKNIESNIDVVINDGFKCFRLSSSLFPFYDLFIDEIESDEEIKSILSNIGSKLLKNNVRLTMHPSEWVILNSKNKDVVNKSILNLIHHAWIMDTMNLPSNHYYTIMIHGGIKDNINSIIENVNLLPSNIKNRLAFENDELSNNVLDLYKVYEQTKCPIVFDSHHHSFNDGGLSAKDAFDLSLSTWTCKALNHLSNTDPSLVNGNFQEKRKHSDYVHYIPDYQLEANNSNLIDIEFEFKAKQLAILDAVSKFGIKL